MYNVFTRTWWRPNADWHGGREPHVGRRTYLARGITEGQARDLCQEWNSTHKPGPMSRKAEFEEATPTYRRN